MGDGRLFTTYYYCDACWQPHVCVKDKKTGKEFFIVYDSHYWLGKALNKLERSKKLSVLSTNYRRY